VLGRGNDVDLQLDDLGVSRRHALLCIQDENLFVEDLESMNGTFVNGQPISSRVAIRAGDTLSLGPCELRVTLASSVRAAAESATQRMTRVAASTAPCPAPLAGLSPRERELLPLLASGLSQRELAAQLGVTVKTIETYRTRIGHKLGLTSRAGLIRFALDHGLLSASTGPTKPYA
jgi:DNA-binding CsgD family transcriptional regulator